MGRYLSFDEYLRLAERHESACRIYLSAVSEHEKAHDDISGSSHSESMPGQTDHVTTQINKHQLQRTRMLSALVQTFILSEISLVVQVDPAL
jgi:hypothetical protein